MFLDSYKFHDFPNTLGTMLFLPHSFNVVHLDSHAQNTMANKTNTKTKKIDTLRSMPPNRHIEDHKKYFEIKLKVICNERKMKPHALNENNND
jgi:hypothetical protein